MDFPRTIFGFPLSAWGFALRTSLAVVLALFTAFFFHLESPYWAATTVFIVANPLRGRVVTKGVFRFLGTTAGGIIAVLFTALFAQTPELFILCMALWIGICTAASNLLRNFRSYGAMLAGYTASIVGFFVVIHTPLHVFNNALERIAAITIGIASSALISGIFAPGGARKDFQSRIRTSILDFSELTRNLLLQRKLSDFAQSHRKLAMKILNLEEVIEYAVSESGKAGGKEVSARLCVTHFMHLMTSVGALAHNLEKSPHFLPDIQKKASQILVTAVQQMGSLVLEEPETVNDWGVMHLYVRELMRLKEECSENSNDVQAMTCLSRMHEMVEQMGKVVSYWKQFHLSEQVEGESVPPMSFHRDYVSAGINGLRAFLVILVTSLFWITTATQYGEQLVFVVSTQCCLVCTRPNPAVASLGFLYGSFWLLPVCFLFQFFIMQHIASAEIFAVLLVVFFVPGCLAMTHPSPLVASTGMSYLIFFMNQSMLLNHSQYQIVAYLNSGLILVIANILTILVFWLVFPVNPLREAQRLVKSLCRETRLLAREDIQLPVRSAWETKMYDRILRLVQHSNSNIRDSEKVLLGSVAILQIGTDIMRLRELSAKQDLAPQILKAIKRALDAFSNINRNFEGQLNEIGAAMLSMNEYSAETPVASLDRWQTVASLHEVVHLLSDYRYLFTDPVLGGNRT